MSRILTLTLNPCIDKTIWIDKLIPNEKLKAKHPEDEAGGGGINVSRAMKYLGKSSKALFFNGGLNGAHFKQLVKDDGVDFEEISIEGTTRMNIMLIDESTTLEYRIGMQGPSISEREIDNLLTVLSKQKDYDFLVASGSLAPNIPDDIFGKIAIIVASHNAKFILDTSGKALQNAIHEKIFLLKPNLNELSNLCGVKEDASIEEILQATQNLLSKINCTAIVVSLGKDGAIMVTAAECHHIISPKVEVKSTVGAGDCMVAGMTIALSQNKPWKEVLQYGIACGTAATLNSGRGLCKQEDVERLLMELRKE
ncbi:MAG: 1-phosphofructokinase family hexose kinase [Chitinophagaceae bacterium]